MGAADSYFDQGRSGCPYIGTYLLGGGAIGPAVWVRDMGPDAAHEEYVGRIPPQGGPQADGEATAEGAGRRLVLTLIGGCDGRGQFAGGGYLHLHPTEHRSAIYCY